MCGGGGSYDVFSVARHAQYALTMIDGVVRPRNTIINNNQKY